MAAHSVETRGASEVVRRAGCLAALSAVTWADTTAEMSVVRLAVCLAETMAGKLVAC